VQVKLQDINEADELFDILFGSDVQSRYNYIQEHSELKYDIDI
jgi:DNA gyrase/topoisomerase IV subunit B